MMSTQIVLEIRGTPLVAAELDKYRAVFSFNMQFPGLFISLNAAILQLFRLY